MTAARKRKAADVRAAKKAAAAQAEQAGVLSLFMPNMQLGAAAAAAGEKPRLLFCGMATILAPFRPDVCQ